MAKENINIIFPTTDITMEIILSSAEDFEANMLSALPSYRSYSLVTNKISLIKLASRIGLVVPESLVIKNKEEILESSENIKFPVIVKPMCSRLYCNGRFVTTSVSYVESREQLLHLYDEKDYLKQPFIIQNIIKGYGAGIFTLFNHGELVAHFSHKRLR